MIAQFHHVTASIKLNNPEQCHIYQDLQLSTMSYYQKESEQDEMSPVKRICVFEHSVMTNFNCACPAIQLGQGFGFLFEGSSWFTACMSKQRMVLARLRKCAGWPEPSLLAQAISTKFAWHGPIIRIIYKESSKKKNNQKSIKSSCPITRNWLSQKVISTTFEDDDLNLTQSHNNNENYHNEDYTEASIS